MNLVKIKALSVNEAWKGRKFKTGRYKVYLSKLWYLLPEIEVPKGNIFLDIEVGYSSRNADIDNFLKPFIDVLQKKYKFNDNKIYKLHVKKNIVEKGKEYIKFKMEDDN